MSEAPTTPSTGESIFDGYSPTGELYDEVFSAPDEIRPAWRDFLTAVAKIGRPELMRRWIKAQEEILATGIAYNIYAESADTVRPWELDLLPQLMGGDEWTALASGLQQRAGLLNRILADLYGPQELLQKGLVPAEWLYSHPGFRRVFHGQKPPEGTFLHFYAADVARAPDGRWWVVGDRTDAPLGIGYALENRIVTSRMLPLRRFHVERLAPFFIALQSSLRELAPTHNDNPRIVLFSRGPSSPDYFEDAYLARYLGYTLVEGGDLAVRDDRVYLKTLAGLLPVDVVFRRLSDDFCDPLEARGQPGLGVPGLLQAARLGHVAIANALGSSLVESPSLMPFLPEIARAWLGQNLALPSVATWWCGQAPARAQVKSLLAQRGLERLSIRAAYRLRRQEAPLPESLAGKTAPEIAQLLDRSPHEWIAQESVMQSTSPVWCDDSPSRWRMALRVFLVACQGGYQAMPGGLVRLAQQPDPLDHSILGGQLSKDTWILADSPVKHVTLLATSRQPVVLRRSGAELPSRVADNLFWFGRRIERAQSACRMLRPIVLRLTGEGELEDTPELSALIHCIAAQGQIEPGFAVEGMKDKLPEIASVLPKAALDETQAGSLRSSVAGAHRNASLVRDRLSLDSWMIVHQLDRILTAASSRQPFGLVELDELLDALIVNLSALDGLIGESMTRTPAWRFLELGRRLERSLQVVALVQSLFAESSEEDPRALEAMLEVADSIMTYRSRYLSAVHRAAALDLLLTDETNPRSLIYQLTAIAGHVESLARRESPLATPEERLADSLLHSVRMLEFDDLAAGGGERTKLGRSLQRVSDQLPKLSELVSHRYLIHAGVPRQMGDGRREPR